MTVDNAVYVLRESVGVRRRGVLVMSRVSLRSRVHYRMLLALSLVIIGVSLVVLFFLALSQLRTIADVYEARELRALGQYAHVAVRECAYRLTQAESELLAGLDVDTQEGLVASLAAIESNRYDVGCFALFEDGEIIYPATGMVERVVPLYTLMVRCGELLAGLDSAGALRFEFEGGGYYPGASCYRLMAREREGIVGFCWSEETVVTWCREVALENVPAGYILEFRAMDQQSLHRYPPDAEPLAVDAALAAAEPFPPDTFSWIGVVWPEDPETVSRIVRQQIVYYCVGIGLLVLMLAVGVGILAVALWRAGELARLKADFASNVSHELRTPLALIRAAGESLGSRRDLAPERAERYLGIIDRETRRLTDMIDNLMRLTRQGREPVYDFKEKDVCAFVRGFVEDYTLHARTAGFEVETDIAVGPLAARIDQDAMTAVLVNLLDNAMKFSPDKRPITVSVGAREGGVEIVIKDRGVGIPAEHVEMVFQDFYRVESDLIKKTRGTGIGLALVREIVTVHSGKVWVDSTPGQGAEFTVRLPVVQESNEGEK